MVRLVCVDDRDQRPRVGERHRQAPVLSSASVNASPDRRARATAVRGAGDIGETLPTVFRECLFGPLRSGSANELGHRLAADRGCSPNLLVELRIETDITAAAARQRSATAEPLGHKRQAVCPH